MEICWWKYNENVNLNENGIKTENDYEKNENWKWYLK